jgi:hypothetical protein
LRVRFSFVVRSCALRVLIAASLGAAALVAVPAAASAAPAAPLTPSAAAGPAAVVTAPAGVRTTITPGLKGFDNGGVVSAGSINCLSRLNGYSLAMVNVNETTYATYNNAAAAGMNIVLFQGYFTWTSPADGKARGGAAATTAGKLGYPKGAMIFLNLEATSSSKVVLAWVQNWIAAVRAGGYLAGIYVGIDPGLTKAQLDTLGGVSGFWKSASTSGVPVVARGYVLQQPTPLDIPFCNTKIDNNFARADNNGAQLIGAAFPKTVSKGTASGAFVPLTPARLLDTRTGGTGPVSARKSVTLQVTGRGGVPGTGVSAVVMNVTATAPTAKGYVSVYPTGRSVPTVSNLNLVPGQTVPNLVTVQLGTNGRVTIVAGGAGTVQVIADVAGYYLSGAASEPGTFVSLTPTRLLDTRNTGTAVKNSQTTVQVAGQPVGSSRIPPTISAAVLNLTAVGPTQRGYLTAYATTNGRPTVSNLNFLAGQTVPNLAAVPLDPNEGSLQIYNGSLGTTDLLADIAGYYLSGSPTATGSYTATTPSRVLDTRSNAASRVGADSAIALQVAGVAGVPATATSVVLNVTVTNPATIGYLSVFPSDTSAPLASNLNFVKGQTVANLVMVPIGADGKIVLDNQSLGAADLIADIAGYFRG